MIQRVTVPPGINPLPFHAYSQGNPQVSADGSAFSYTEYSNCDGGSACIQYPSTSTSFLKVDGQTDQKLIGEAQISRDGRFVLNHLTTYCPIPAQPDVIQLHDLPDRDDRSAAATPSQREAGCHQRRNRAAAGPADRFADTLDSPILAPGLHR